MASLDGDDVILQFSSTDLKKEKYDAEQIIERCCQLKQPQMKRYQQEYLDQDEFVYIEKFLPDEVLNQLFLPPIEETKKFIHRSYIPMHKKGGSVSAFTLSKQAPIYQQLYQSKAFLRFIYQIIFQIEQGSSPNPSNQEPEIDEEEMSKRLMLCPQDDPHSVALYFYTEPGDHIGFHYDSSFYKGIRYTLLLGLIDRSSCRLVCNLHTRNNHRNSTVTQNNVYLQGELIDSKKTVETHHLQITPGSIVLFNGDKVYHAVTPLKKGEERVVLTMEFVTSQEMGMVERAISNVKDAVSYFGIGSLVGWYEGYNNDSKNTEDDEQTLLIASQEDHGEDAHEEGEDSDTHSIVAEDEMEDPTTRPTIIAFVNKLSGGQRGTDIIPELRQYLGDNVYDMNEMGGPEPGLLQHKDTPNLRVIACGGDGTIRWVIQGLINLGFKPLPPLGVFPLGTGNDLSRMFGWGPGYKGEPASGIISNMRRAKSKPMDLWTCSMIPWDPVTGETKDAETNTQIMFNYYNIGFDPQVAHSFHSLRLSSPHLFKARIINKAWYMFYALSNILRGSYQLQDVCTLAVDGNPIEIPYGVKTIVILNFICYQAGVDIWGPDDKNEAKMDDGMVEVVGINGVYHEALIRSYLSAGIRLGRGREVQLKVTKPIEMPMAFDGEPFMHSPVIVNIRPFTQIQVLENPDFVQE